MFNPTRRFSKPTWSILKLTGLGLILQIRVSGWDDSQFGKKKSDVFEEKWEFWINTSRLVEAIKNEEKGSRSHPRWKRQRDLRWEYERIRQTDFSFPFSFLFAISFSLFFNYSLPCQHWSIFKGIFAKSWVVQSVYSFKGCPYKFIQNIKLKMIV